MKRKNFEGRRQRRQAEALLRQNNYSAMLSQMGEEELMAILPIGGAQRQRKKFLSRSYDR